MGEEGGETGRGWARISRYTVPKGLNSYRASWNMDQLEILILVLIRPFDDLLILPSVLPLYMPPGPHRALHLARGQQGRDLIVGRSVRTGALDVPLDRHAASEIRQHARKIVTKEEELLHIRLQPSQGFLSCYFAHAQVASKHGFMSHVS